MRRFSLGMALGLAGLLGLHSAIQGQPMAIYQGCQPCAAGEGGGGSGTVTSVDLSVPSWLAVTGNPVTDAGTLAVAAASGQTAGRVIGTCGAATSFGVCVLVDSDIPNNITVDNATTATALAANGANCSAGQFPLGVNASGAAESCSAALAGNADTATALAANGANCGAASFPLGVDASGAVESCSTSISGNSGTATALAANGTNCGAGNYPLGVDAAGNAESCTAVTAGVGGNLGVIDNAAARADGTGGATIQGSPLIVSDVASDVVTLSPEDGVTTNLGFVIDPKGSGAVRIPADVNLLDGTSYHGLRSGDIRVSNNTTNDPKIIIATSGYLGLYDATAPNIKFTRSINAENAHDAGLSSTAAELVEFTDGGSGGGWFRWAGQCRAASAQTNATTTPASTTCSITLRNSRKYVGVCRFALSDDVAADGAAIDFDGGTATASDFRAHCNAYDSALALSTQTTALATDVAIATFTGAGMVECQIINLETSGAGTFIPRFFQNAHTTGTLTLAKGSHCQLYDIN